MLRSHNQEAVHEIVPHACSRVLGCCGIEPRRLTRQQDRSHAGSRRGVKDGARAQDLRRGAAARCGACDVLDERAFQRALDDASQDFSRRYIAGPRPAGQRPHVASPQVDDETSDAFVR